MLYRGSKLINKLDDDIRKNSLIKKEDLKI